MPFTSPEFLKSAFNCPFCDAYSRMNWFRHYFRSSGGGFSQLPMHFARCTHCGERSYWVEKSHLEGSEAGEGKMLLPSGAQAPMPHPEIPEEIRVNYEEARNIVGDSPRGAAALLRLAIQKLCVHLGESGQNLNNDIGSLVQKGLPVEIQQALDIVRVTGNNAVHPGELSQEDVAAVALPLFELINQIVEDRIARPKKLRELFENLPEGARERISMRDGNGGQDGS